MDSTVVQELIKFHDNILHTRGHKHLYHQFDIIKKACIQGEATSDEAQQELICVINVLLSEAALFYKGYPFYPQYVLRCYNCAKELLPYVSRLSDRDYFDNRMKDLLCHYLDSPLFEYLPDNMYEDATRHNNLEDTARLIIELFQNSDCGRRPRADLNDELILYKNFKRGYELSRNYIHETNDYIKYSEWFKVLDPIHIGNILASIPKNKSYDQLGDLIDETLELQIDMLNDWKEHSYKAFCEFGGIVLLDKLKDIREVYHLSFARK